MINSLFFFSDQCLELCKASAGDTEAVRGQIIVSLLSRDGGSGGRSPLAVVGPAGDLRPPTLPSGWEERTTGSGR